LLALESTKNLKEIHLPVNSENGDTDSWEGPHHPEEYLITWRLDTDFGVNRYLYHLKEKKVVQIY
jgi:hypothetical protein